MLTSAQCLKKYGPPDAANKCMVLWDVPTALEIGILPKRLYCNRDLIEPASKAFAALISSHAVHELKTFDGCFNIRQKRGQSSMSLHSWGVALDFDAFRNQMGKAPTMNHKVVACFLDNGFDWGGYWKGKSCDGMHFQLKTI